MLVEVVTVDGVDVSVLGAVDGVVDLSVVWVDVEFIITVDDLETAIVGVELEDTLVVALVICGKLGDAVELCEVSVVVTDDEEFVTFDGVGDDD